jgi:hypothetical protein
MKKENAIRPAASEHFYEDFGNNLTRIQVLSEMLERKIQATDPEGKQLIELIRKYLASLWLGARDMLWALSHGNHTLGELVNRLGHIGIEIFRDESRAVFIIENKIKKPLDIIPPHYCLNILILFKELMLACSEYPAIPLIRLRAENTMVGEVIFSLMNTAEYSLQEHLEKKLDLVNLKKCAGRLRAFFSIDYSVDGIVICRLICNPL